MWRQAAPDGRTSPWTPSTGCWVSGGFGKRGSSLRKRAIDLVGADMVKRNLALVIGRQRDSVGTHRFQQAEGAQDVVGRTVPGPWMLRSTWPLGGEVEHGAGGARPAGGRRDRGRPGRPARRGGSACPRAKRGSPRLPGVGQRLSRLTTGLVAGCQPVEHEVAADEAAPLVTRIICCPVDLKYPPIILLFRGSFVG